MLIQYHGHDEFLLTLDDGFTVLFDPYDAHVGYPTPPLTADVTLATHFHFDHHAVDRVAQPTRVIDTAGTHTLAPGVAVQAVEVDHDAEKGKLRGKNLIFRLEAEGISLVHFGDLGVDLSAVLPEQVDFDLHEARQAVMDADIWLLPVGGFYTIDAAAALNMAEAYKPKIVIPMHYKTATTSSWPIADLAAFLEGRPGWEKCALLRVTKADMSCQPSTAVLMPFSE